MGLSHLKLQVETIETPAGNFSVRGLNLDDIASIAAANMPAVSALFELVAAREMELQLNDPAALMGALGASAPGIAAMIIAAGADEPDIATVGFIPFPAQLAALETIGRLTFATQSPKKVLEIVIGMARGVSASLAAT